MSALIPGAIDSADHAASHTELAPEPRSQPSTSTARSGTSKTRALEPRPGYGKYDNPAAALAPNRRLTWTVPPSPAQPGQLLICEGIPDALIAAQAGYQSVGLLGTNALDPTVAMRIANIATRDALEVTIITDNDESGVGEHLGEQLSAELSKYDCGVTVLEPPDGHDLTTWSLRDHTWSRAVGPSTSDGSLLRDTDSIAT